MQEPGQGAAERRPGELRFPGDVYESEANAAGCSWIGSTLATRKRRSWFSMGCRESTMVGTPGSCDERYLRSIAFHE